MTVRATPSEALPAQLVLPAAVSARVALTDTLQAKIDEPARTDSNGASL